MKEVMDIKYWEDKNSMNRMEIEYIEMGFMEEMMD